MRKCEAENKLGNKDKGDGRSLKGAGGSTTFPFCVGRKADMEMSSSTEYAS